MKEFREYLEGKPSDDKTHCSELLQVLISGEEAREVVALDNLIYDADGLQALLKFIDGKTYHIRISEVRDGK